MDDRQYVAARDSARKILAALDPTGSAAEIAASVAQDAALRQVQSPLESVDEDEGQPIAAIAKDLRADVKHLRAVLKSGELGSRDKKLIRKALEKVRSITGEQPVDEQPVAEQPVDEQPVAEQPVDEQPVDEQPVDEQPVAEQPVAEQPVAEQPVAEQPVAEQPVAEQPVDEQPVAEQPVAEQQFSRQQKRKGNA